MNFCNLFCATYFELTYPVLQNSCEKKSLGGIMFYKHLLLYLVSHLSVNYFFLALEKPYYLFEVIFLTSRIVPPIQSVL